jgi:hypothetical protein
VKSHEKDVVDAVGTGIGILYLLKQKSIFALAAIHPCWGIVVRNFKLAGQRHPVTGVPFDDYGFPDFSTYLYQGGKNDVVISPNFFRIGDVNAANKIAGYTVTPKGYVWHHHQDYGRMQLVLESIHEKTAHTGGYKIWRLF